MKTFLNVQAVCAAMSITGFAGLSALDGAVPVSALPFVVVSIYVLVNAYQREQRLDSAEGRG